MVRILRVCAALVVLNVLVQFVTAGELFPQGGPEAIHRAGALVLHLTTGAALVAAGLLAWRDRGYLRLAVLAGVVFVAGFVQAAVGGRSTLWIHVPGAMLLTAGAVWLLVASFSATPVGSRPAVTAGAAGS